MCGPPVVALKFLREVNPAFSKCEKTTLPRNIRKRQNLFQP